MGAGIASPRIIGRSDELAALDAALRDAAGGRPSIVVIAGPAGIGKSRLIAEFAQRAGAAGARFLVGDCLELVGGGLPYGPLVSVLRELARGMAPDRLREIVGPALPDLARLVPELGVAASGGAPTSTAIDAPALDRTIAAPATSPHPDVGPAGDAHAAARLLEHTLGVLGRLGAESPCVVVFEDVQWIDTASRDVVSFLAHSLRTERVLLALTFRNDNLPRGHPLTAWLADLQRTARATLLAPAPLSRTETADQLAAIVGTVSDADLAARIHARSEGNPLFNEELLATVRTGSQQLPAALSDALLAAVARLPEGTTRALSVAAVAARPFDERFLAAVLGGGEEAYLEPVRAAVMAQVLAAGPSSYRFRHGLFAEAIVGGLTPGERRMVHAQIAEALDQHPDLAEGGEAGVAGESADHWYAAGRLPEAFQRSAQAAIGAGAIHADQVALQRWEQCLGILEQVEPSRRSGLLTSAGLDDAGLLIRAAQSASLADAHDRAVALAQRALAEVDRADPDRLATMLSDEARILWVAGQFDAAQEAQRQAFDLMQMRGSAADRAVVLSRYATMLLWQGHVDDGIGIARRAVEAARLTGGRAIEAQALESLGNGLWLAGSMREAIERFVEARSAAIESGGVEEELFASDSLAECLIDADRFEEALAVAIGAGEVARRHGLDRAYGAMFRGNAGLAQFALGRWTEADETTQEGIDVGHGRIWALSVRARLLAACGRFGDSERVLDTVATIYPGELPEIVQLECALPRAEQLVLKASAETALQTVMAALAVRAPHAGLRIALAATGMRAAADAAGDARARRDGRVLETVIRNADSCLAELRAERLILAEWDPATPSKLATADLGDAEAARMAGDSDPEQWAAVTAAFERALLPYQVAYARYRHAEALLQREGVRASAAHGLLRAAYEQCASLGAQPLAAEIQQLARHARVGLGQLRGATGGDGHSAVAAPPAERHRRPARAASTGGLRLSPRERQVLALVAAGRTNGQIAVELFISLKTASVHVTHILDKLGATNRIEAAMIADRAGLLVEDEPADIGSR